MSDFSKQIQELDLNSIMVRMAHDSVLSETALKEAEVQYRQFLQLCLEDTGTVPTELADKVWHYHILDTQKYATDCETLFGEFMHHKPALEMTPDLQEKAQDTLGNWARRFAQSDQTYISAVCSR